MKPWMTVDEVKARIRRDWDRGHLLKAFWTGSGMELPYRIVLRGPESAQWSDQFDDARKWILQWEGFPVEWRDFSHPRLGRNRVPIALSWPELKDLFAVIGKKAEAERFLLLAHDIVERFPDLHEWVENHPHQVLAHSSNWPRFFDLFDWMKTHPRPGIYLRQIDLPGVNTKFLENHRGILSELLDQILPPDAIDRNLMGAGKFARRYGFLEKPALVRFRHLDPRTTTPRDQTWRVDDWANWQEAPRRVFITENEVNFLAFPEQKDALVVFGSGYGFEAWRAVHWLKNADVWYWGDVDTHGFAILDQARGVLANLNSLMMDEKTLLAHREFWGNEPEPALRTLTRLTPAENQVFESLKSDQWAVKLRLEQERIGYNWVIQTLDDL